MKSFAMAVITVDGKQLEVENGLTVLQACEAAGAEIPRFCYHERLEIAGNCRMCLVMVEKSPKPVASCSVQVTDGMVIYTDNEQVKEWRSGVMEFLLINHPLDCPVCDQGGECDLQDQAMLYGRDRSYFNETKRAVTDKYMGPLIKTHMTRCIHCTRCVRFIEDVAGTCELGAVHRGNDMQISTYIEKSITSELSGNIIDLCPVGALTSKPYAYRCRSWELTSTPSIDVLDAVGSNIRIDSKGQEVMRILPRLHEEVNEEWLADKSRFACDALKYQRLDTAMCKQDGKLTPCSLSEAYNVIQTKLEKTTSQKVGAIAGDLVDVEAMLASKLFLKVLGSENIDCRQDGATYSNSDRANYIFNTSIMKAEEADLCIIIGSNPRLEAPLLCSRLRKAVRHNNMKVLVIGEEVDLAMPYKYLGQSPWILKQIVEDQHPIANNLQGFKKPMLIVGSGAMARPDHLAILHYTKKLANKLGALQEDWQGLNILQRAASRVGGLDIGFIPGKNGMATAEMLASCEVLFLLGADEVPINTIPENTFVIYIGHHGDKAAARADVILPAPAYTEKMGTYVNLEGRVQRTNMAVPPIGNAKPEWLLMHELAANMGITLPYNTLEELWYLMEKQNNIFSKLDTLWPSKIDAAPGKQYNFVDDKLVNPITNYYQADPISRNSRTMAKCRDM